MKVKLVQVVFRDLVILHNRSVRDDSIAFARQHGTRRLTARHILVTVADPFNDPRRLDVHEDRVVIRAVLERQNAHDPHLQGIFAR